ncbi:Hint domain-containing protein [Acidocella sp.]|uniref:Hint domain-containing protein n=1 Tax=Acidocella sp. TaxID=50710 RepID=UPI00261C67C0|nr:Hint domain-containing protein [Acidocella sp.]
MSGTLTTESFQAVASGTYNSATGVFTATSGNLLSGGGKTTESITAASSVEYPNGGTTSLSSTGYLTGTWYFVGDATVGKFNGIVVTNGAGNYYFLSPSNPGNDLKTGVTSTVNTSYGWNFSTGAEVTCFFPGTLIATPSGEVAVETLKSGDLVTLADGRAAPITWLGRQTVSTRFADPLRVNPIRIKAGALGENLPVRDLRVSPDHALLVDGVLVHAGALVNGRSILRETDLPTIFTYYHIEVADHSLILAEAVPAETFIDNVDRLAFDNWEEHPGNTALVEMSLPRAKSARQVPAATKSRLEARATALFQAAIQAA